MSGRCGGGGADGVVAVQEGRKEEDTDAAGTKVHKDEDEDVK